MHEKVSYLLKGVENTLDSLDGGRLHFDASAMDQLYMHLAQVRAMSSAHDQLCEMLADGEMNCLEPDAHLLLGRIEELRSTVH